MSDCEDGALIDLAAAMMAKFRFLEVAATSFGNSLSLPG